MPVFFFFFFHTFFKGISLAVLRFTDFKNGFKLCVTHCMLSRNMVLQKIYLQWTRYLYNTRNVYTRVNGNLFVPIFDGLQL